MTDTPLCKQWRGKYPVVLTQVFDDMFWKARVKYERREEIAYDKTWDNWAKGTFYKDTLKKSQDKLTTSQPERNVFSNLSLADIQNLKLTDAQRKCLTSNVRNLLDTKFQEK